MYNRKADSTHPFLSIVPPFSWVYIYTIISLIKHYAEERKIQASTLLHENSPPSVTPNPSLYTPKPEIEAAATSTENRTPPYSPTHTKNSPHQHWRNRRNHHPTRLFTKQGLIFPTYHSNTLSLTKHQKQFDPNTINLPETPRLHQSSIKCKQELRSMKKKTHTPLYTPDPILDVVMTLHDRRCQDVSIHTSGPNEKSPLVTPLTRCTKPPYENIRSKSHPPYIPSPPTPHPNLSSYQEPQPTKRNADPTIRHQDPPLFLHAPDNQQFWPQRLPWTA